MLRVLLESRLTARTRTTRVCIKSPRGGRKNGQRHMPRPIFFASLTADPLQNWGSIPLNSPDEHLWILAQWTVPLNISHSTHTRTVATHVYIHTHVCIHTYAYTHTHGVRILYSVEYKSSLTMRWRPHRNNFLLPLSADKKRALLLSGIAHVLLQDSENMQRS